MAVVKCKWCDVMPLPWWQLHYQCGTRPGTTRDITWQHGRPGVMMTQGITRLSADTSHSGLSAQPINSGLEDNSILIPASQGYCVLISKSLRVWAEHSIPDKAGIQISFSRLRQQQIRLGWVRDCKFLAGYENIIKIIRHQGGPQTLNTAHSQL